MASSYPSVGFHFSVVFNIDGASGMENGFQEVNGFEMGFETIVKKEGGENRFSHTLPVRGQYNTLTLRRGLIQDSRITEWCRKAIEDLDIQPVSVQVTLLNEEHTPLQSWNFVNAWPKKWSVSSLHAEKSQLVIETIELVYQYFKRV